MSLAKGIPVVAGMDHKDGSPNLIKNGGDGVTDHYVAIIEITVNFTKDNNGKGSISSGTIRYANPGCQNAANGMSPKNKFTFSSATNWRGVNGHRIMTNLRVKNLKKMKYQLLTILLFFAFNRMYSVNKQEVRSENDSTFTLLEPY